MTEAFSRDFSRTSFGPPLPVSDSLRAVSHKPISWFRDSWENHLDITEPRTVAESVFPTGLYVAPSLDEVNDKLQAVFGALESTSSFLKVVNSDIYRAVRKLDGSGRRPPYNSVRRLSSDEAIAIALYTGGVVRANDNSIGFNGVDGYTVAREPWSDEIGAMLFQWSMRHVSEWDDIRSPVMDALTIGDFLEVVSHSPTALARMRDSGSIRQNTIWDAARFGKHELCAVGGEGWMAYLFFVVSTEGLLHEKRGWEALVSDAKWFIETGLPVEELQRYVASMPHSTKAVELLKSIIESGISPDMVGTIATSRY